MPGPNWLLANTNAIVEPAGVQLVSLHEAGPPNAIRVADQLRGEAANDRPTATRHGAKSASIRSELVRPQVSNAPIATTTQSVGRELSSV